MKIDWEGFATCFIGFQMGWWGHVLINYLRYIWRVLKDDKL